VGANGSGKTTLLRIAAGELAPSAGEVRYPALDATTSRWNSARRHIAYVPQQPEPWYGTLAEGLHLVASLHGTRGAANEEDVKFTLQRFGINEYADLTPSFPQASGCARPWLGPPSGNPQF
jgi:ABC-type multidrug transport system ATPase subunit